MKKGFFATEFAVLLLFFVLPPIVFASKMPSERVMQFSWQTFVLAAFAAVLWWHLRNETQTEAEAHSAEQTRTGGDEQKLHRFMHQGYALLTFGAIVVCAGISELAGRFLLHTNDAVRLHAPASILGWVNVGLGTVCAAFYEEVLYRVYLPGALKRLFCKRPSCADGTVPHFTKKAFACEACAVVLFALAHRYLGWLSVANAAVAGALLRRCYRKTDRLWTNLAAHVAYNAVMLGIALA